MASERPDTLDVFTLGAAGVVIDPHPLQPGVPPYALTIAQNATHDARAGFGGAVRKRPGLVRFNQASAGGPVLGGIPMGVAGTGGAPATGGGGVLGDGAGSGEGTGAPGQTTDGTGTSNAGASAGAGSFNGGSSLFSGARLIVLGLDTNNGDDGYGWYLSSKRLADAAQLVTTPGPPGAALNTGMDYGQHGRPFVQTGDGWVYYMVANSESTSGNTPQVRRTNGASDQAVITITAEANPNDQALVVSMAYGNGTVFIGVRDSIWNATTAGRILLVDHTTRNLRATLPVLTRVPYCMTWAGNRLFYGLNPIYTELAVAAGSLAAWSEALGTGIEGVDAYSGSNYNEPFTKCVVEFNGCLYIGTLADSAGSHGNFLYAAALDSSVLGGLGTPTGLSGGALSTLAGGTIAGYAGIQSLVEYKGALYASWYNSGHESAIVKGTVVTAGSPGLTWTSAWSDTGASDRVPYQLYVDAGGRYAIGTRGMSANKHVMWTEDGVTWTDATSTFFTNNPSTGYPINVFFGLSQ